MLSFKGLQANVGLQTVDKVVIVEPFGDTAISPSPTKFYRIKPWMFLSQTRVHVISITTFVSSQLAFFFPNSIFIHILHFNLQNQHTMISKKENKSFVSYKKMP